MAKDDYSTLVCKVLVYYYACLKRKTVFSEAGFYHAIGKGIDEGYLTDVLIMMAGDGLITGVSYAKAWGREKILTSDLDEIEVTSAGINYLNENDTMKGILHGLVENADTIASLAMAAVPFIGL